MCRTWVILSKKVCQTELRSRVRFNCMFLENFCNTSLECSQEPNSFQECRATSSGISYYSCLFSRSVWEAFYLPLKASTGHPPGSVRLRPQFVPLILSPGLLLPPPRAGRLGGSSWVSPPAHVNTHANSGSCHSPASPPAMSQGHHDPAQTHVCHNLDLLCCHFHS